MYKRKGKIKIVPVIFNLAPHHEGTLVIEIIASLFL
jgi:hypothetical protein